MTLVCRTSPTGIQPLTEAPSDPWEVVRANELAASPQDRADRGAWYTPRAVAELITARAFGPGVPAFIVDPTCGGGAFLLAALDELVARGVSPSDAVDRVAGLDIDPRAVATAREVIRMWAAGHGVPSVESHIEVGDALADWPTDWPVAELVVGNPPFASPLRATKSRSSAELPPAAAAFREEHRSELGPYADLAAMHLLNAAHRVDPSTGRLVMVLPQSMLAGRDAAPLREWLASALPLEDLWISGEKLFDANVRVFAPVLARSAPAANLSWTEAAATEMGVPDPGLSATTGVLGSMCEATAGFRDEYYGMAAACVEGEPDDERCRLVTVGAVEPLEVMWGVVPTRFAKTLWERPVVDEAAVPMAVRPWFERQRSPKVLLPTQARILEPFVDREGTAIPITPLLSISTLSDSGAPEDLDLIAAVLLAPAVAAWAARRGFGSALSTNAIKLRAADVLDIPLPADRTKWREAAALVTDGPTAVDRIAELMHDAYAGTPDVMRWWQTRRN